MEILFGVPEYVNSRVFFLNWKMSLSFPPPILPHYPYKCIHGTAKFRKFHITAHVVCCTVLACCMYFSWRRMTDNCPESPPGAILTLGRMTFGHKTLKHIFCTGSRGPTVVLSTIRVVQQHGGFETLTDRLRQERRRIQCENEVTLE